MLKRSLLLVLLCGTISAAQLKAVRQYPIDMNHSTVGFSVAIMDGLSGTKLSGQFFEKFRDAGVRRDRFGDGKQTLIPPSHGIIVPAQRAYAHGGTTSL